MDPGVDFAVAGAGGGGAAVRCAVAGLVDMPAVGDGDPVAAAFLGGEDGVVAAELPGVGRTTALDLGRNDP